MNNKQITPLLSLLPAIVGIANTPKSQPNVILIYADDLGYGDLQCYGAQNVQTPNVNRLASEGTLFTNAYAMASTSTPSRYGLLTGQYAWRKKGTDIAPGNAGMIIRPEQFTIADMFKNIGYKTAAIGKWHLGLGDKTGEQDWNKQLSPALEDIGFEYSYIMAATADRVPCVFIENGKVANYDSTAPIYVSYKKNFEGEPTGKNNPELLYNLHASHGHNQSIVNGIGRIGYMKGGGKALWKDENIADSIVKHAIDFIEKNKNTPFFMYFATNDVHVPRFPHERFRGKNIMGLRGDAIAQFDWSVGQILDALDRLGLTKNTLVILTSDNGPVLDDGYKDNAIEKAYGHSMTGGLRGGKYGTFEGGSRIPAIVRYPNVTPKGKISNAMLTQADLLASLSTLIGGKIPEGTAQDSHNYIKTWLGKSNKGVKYVIQQAADHTLSIRTKDWKYIEPSKNRPLIWGPMQETGYRPFEQLYNMKEDDRERVNVAKSYPKIVKTLQLELQKVKQNK